MNQIVRPPLTISPRMSVISLPAAPDPDCQRCGGIGRIVPATGGSAAKCVCLIRSEARNYLTKTYADAFHHKADVFPPSGVAGKNILIHNDPKKSIPAFSFVYRSIVKSYLLNTGMQLRHMTACGQDVIDAWIGRTETTAFTDMHAVDLLILYLAADPPNKEYTSVMTSLISKRMAEERATWVVTHHHLDDRMLGSVYSPALEDYIRKNFVLRNTRHIEALARR